MGNLKTCVKTTMALSVLSMVAMLFSHLALTDIYHGEADVSLEWAIVQSSALVILVFAGSALFTLSRVLKRMK